MKPCSYSTQHAHLDWRHRGEDVCYYKNACAAPADADEPTRPKRRLESAGHVLTFTYTFAGPDVVYFAHTFPYTYTDLKKALAALEDDPRVAGVMHRKELCATLAGNTCEVVTVTSRAGDGGASVGASVTSGGSSTSVSGLAALAAAASKPAVVLSARVHPGESNSSYMLQGALEFLVSDCAEARALRDAFVFKVGPRLKPHPQPSPTPTPCQPPTQHYSTIHI